jgi:hypothetical protein
MIFASFLGFWAVAAKRKFISCPFGPRKRKSVEPEDAFQISEEHLDLLTVGTARQA